MAMTDDELECYAMIGRDLGPTSPVPGGSAGTTLMRAWNTIGELYVKLMEQDARIQELEAKAEERRVVRLND